MMIMMMSINNIMKKIDRYNDKRGIGAKRWREREEEEIETRRRNRKKKTRKKKILLIIITM